MNKEYIYKQLDLIENEMKDVYDTMVEHGFNLTPDDVNNIMNTISIRTDNIKRELSKEDEITKNFNNYRIEHVNISKRNRPEVKEEIRKYLDSSL